jgi:zinc-ribbon domain
LPFCLNCGAQLPIGAKFCGSCGAAAGVAPSPASGPPQAQADEPVIHSQTVSETSRLSGVGIEKFLGPGERVVHVTSGRIRYANQQRYAYVTNKRVLFYGQQGVMLGLVKQDRLDEVYLNQIRKLKLVETGMISKKVYLELDEMKLVGQRGYLLDLYRAIQSARASV